MPSRHGTSETTTAWLPCPWEDRTTGQTHARREDGPTKCTGPSPVRPPRVHDSVRLPRQVVSTGTGVLSQSRIQRNKSILEDIRNCSENLFCRRRLEVTQWCSPPQNDPGKLCRCTQDRQLLQRRYLPLSILFLLPFLESLNPSLQLNLSKSQRKEGDRPLLGSGRGYCIREEEVVSGEEESVVSERYCSTEAAVLPPAHWNELDPWCSGSIRGRPDLDGWMRSGTERGRRSSRCRPATAEAARGERAR
jgi:hypothetical protein